MTMYVQLIAVLTEYIDIKDSHFLIERNRLPVDRIIGKKMVDKVHCIRTDHNRIDLLNNLFDTFWYTDSSMDRIDIHRANNHWHQFDNQEDNYVSNRTFSNREKSMLERTTKFEKIWTFLSYLR